MKSKSPFLDTLQNKIDENQSYAGGPVHLLARSSMIVK